MDKVNQIKYLYYYGKYNDHNVYRIQIIRETNNFYIVSFNNQKFEYKVNKKTMSCGKGYDVEHYYEETPELLKEYRETIIKKRYQLWLKTASTVTDIEFMEKIIAIPISILKKE